MSARLICVVPGALAAVLASAAAAVSEIVCWTDDAGRRACGDRVPPEYAKRERQVYDRSGRLVDTLPRQPTPEEVEEARRRSAEEEAARKRAAEQAAYDRFLVTTYTSVHELERARDDRLRILDGRLRLAEQSLRDNETGIRQLQEQIAAAEQNDAEAPARLSEQLAEFERTLADNRRAVEKLRAEREQLILKYERDIARYRELTARAGPTASGTPVPAARQLTRPGFSP